MRLMTEEEAATMWNKWLIGMLVSATATGFCAGVAAVQSGLIAPNCTPFWIFTC